MNPTAKQIQKMEYETFKKEWIKTHGISKPPSFTSWKQNYRTKKMEMAQAIDIALDTMKQKANRFFSDNNIEAFNEMMEAIEKIKTIKYTN